MADQLTLSQNRSLRLLTLCALYMAQGIPWGFVAITLAAWLAQQGLSAEDVASVAVLSGLPWTFKWVWGPIIDRYGLVAMGRRRPWILLAQLLMAGTLLAIVAIPDITESVRLLAWMIFLHNVFNSLQDVSVDALAVDLLPEDERGKANGLMFGSKYLGGAIGGAGMATVLAHSGIRVALLVQVGVLALIFLLPLLLRERPGERLLPWSRGQASARAQEDRADSIRDVFADLLRAFSFRSSLLAAVLALTMTTGAGLLAVVSVVFLVQELGWTDTEYATLTGGWGLACGLAGSILGGFVADRFGHRRTIATGCLVLAVLWVTFGVFDEHWIDRRFVSAVVLLDSFAISVAAVGFFALAMGVSWPRVAATQFTAYMALSNLSQVSGGWLAGKLDGIVSVPNLYVACGVFQALVALVLLGIDAGQVRRALGSGEDRSGESFPRPAQEPASEGSHSAGR